MPRKKTPSTPTEEEILSYNNVPLDVAAKYIGWSTCNVSWALQQERAPYGHAAQTGSKEDGTPTYSYNISPGLLIAYKRGELEAWKLGELRKVLAAEFNEIIDNRMLNIAAMLMIPEKNAKAK